MTAWPQSEATAHVLREDHHPATWGFHAWLVLLHMHKDAPIKYSRGQDQQQRRKFFFLCMSIQQQCMIPRRRSPPSHGSSQLEHFKERLVHAEISGTDTRHKEIPETNHKLTRFHTQNAAKQNIDTSSNTIFPPCSESSTQSHTPAILVLSLKLGLWR